MPGAHDGIQPRLALPTPAQPPMNVLRQRLEEGIVVSPILDGPAEAVQWDGVMNLFSLARQSCGPDLFGGGARCYSPILPDPDALAQRLGPLEYGAGGQGVTNCHGGVERRAAIVPIQKITGRLPSGADDRNKGLGQVGPRDFRPTLEIVQRVPRHVERGAQAARRRLRMRRDRRRASVWQR